MDEAFYVDSKHCKIGTFIIMDHVTISIKVKITEIKHYGVNRVIDTSY